MDELFCNVFLCDSLVWNCGCCVTMLSGTIEWYETLFLCVTEWSPVLLCLLVVCCYVCPGLGLNSMRDLGVEETPNGLDKPSAERNLTKI